MNKFRTLTLVCTALLLPSLVACAGAQTEAQKPAPMTKTAEANSVSQLFSVFHDDGRFYAFGDHEVYRTFIGGHEPAYVLTRIAGGPQKQTLTFGMTKADSKANVATLGYMNLYAGTAEPAADFYGEVVKDGRFYVFDDWHDMKEFHNSGEAPYIFTHIGKGPNRATVTVVRNKKTVKDSAKADAIMARFRTLHGL